MKRYFTSKINENRPGYKETLAGWIPNDWDYVRAQDITELSAGGTPSTSVDEYWGGDILWMRSGDLNLKRICDVKGRITNKGLNNSSAFLIPKHSVLIGLAGQGKTRGTVAINEVELAANQSVAAFIPDKTKSHYLYIFYDLEHRYNELRRLSTGEGGRGGLNLNLLGNLRFALPPLTDQKKIVGILTTWDKTIVLVGKQIEVKQRLKMSLMQQLLTGKMRFPGFGKNVTGKDIPDNWEEIKLSKLLKEKSERNQLNGISLVLSCSKIYGIIAQSERFEKRIAAKDISRYKVVRKRDLVYDPMLLWDTSIGFVENYDEGVVSPAYNTFKYTGDNDIYDYLKHLLYSYELKHFYKVISQGTNRRRRKASSSAFLTLRIKIPKSLDELRKIRNTLSGFDDEIAILEKKFIALKKQKQGLMQKLLTGEVRLKV